MFDQLVKRSDAVWIDRRAALPKRGELFPLVT